MMALGLGTCRLAPKDFWAMTAFEFLTAAGLVHQGGAPFTRAKLEQMIKDHPDMKPYTKR